MAEKKTKTVTNQAGTKVTVDADRAEVLEERAKQYESFRQSQDSKGK